MWYLPNRFLDVTTADPFASLEQFGSAFVSASNGNKYDHANILRAGFVK
ncbi:MAG: hypothetical protein HN909_04870 [Phycisphaerales bacterium]|jgi:hypothetical protein|nr:hypothetical protein [Phycisphaerales bacterium]MBT7171084.1 hypothetical protein [Phycisphaerales bacterium]